MSLVKIVNTGSTPYLLQHDIHEPAGILLQPGADRIVQLEVALYRFGNPGAVNRGPSKQERLRDAELTRIQTLHGYYAGVYSADAWEGVGTNGFTDQPIGPFRPECEVYDLDGNRMWMVHDDPAGVRRSQRIADHIVDVTSGKAVEAEIDELKNQIRLLSDIVAARSADTKGSAPELDPASVESKLGAALEPGQTQAERNEQRDEIPAAPATGTVGRDRPRTSRSGSRAGV